MKIFGAFVLAILCFSCHEKEPPAAAPALPRRPAADLALAHADSLNPYAPIDRSPMDVSYFPEDYPVQKMLGKAAPLPLARVIYSRPQKQGRAIFGALIPYGEPWRLGANEATELELFQPAKVQNQQLPKGRYVLYAVPQKESWKIVCNNHLFGWGLKIHPEQDAFSFTVPVQNTAAPIEYFSMVFQAKAKGADLVIAWDTVVARLPLVFDSSNP